MTREMTLHLDDVKYLFVEPEFDPFAQHGGDVSGVDYLVTLLRPSALRQKARLTIFLPPEKIASGLETKVKEALTRYCLFKTQQNHSAIVALRWKGIKALQSGIVVLSSALFLSGLIGSQETLPEWLTTFLSEGLLIAGWVSLWYPVEVLLYEWWPYWYENRIYEYISKMDIVIKANP